MIHQVWDKINEVKADIVSLSSTVSRNDLCFVFRLARFLLSRFGRRCDASRVPNPWILTLMHNLAEAGLTKDDAWDLVVKVDSSFDPPRPLETPSGVNQKSWSNYWTKYIESQ
jgi:hypothetical protein